MSTKCNYTYDKMNCVLLALEGRMVDKKIITLDQAKQCISDVRVLFYTLANNKKLTEELYKEGKKAIENSEKKAEKQDA